MLLNRYDEAEETSKIAAEKFPRAFQNYINLAMIMYNCGDYGQALRYVNKGLEIYKDGGLLFLKGFFEYLLGNTSSAVKVLRDNPNFIFTHALLGDIYFTSGEYYSSLRHYTVFLNMLKNQGLDLRQPFNLFLDSYLYSLDNKHVPPQPEFHLYEKILGLDDYSNVPMDTTTLVVSTKEHRQGKEMNKVKTLPSILVSMGILGHGKDEDEIRKQKFVLFLETKFLLKLVWCFTLLDRANEAVAVIDTHFGHKIDGEISFSRCFQREACLLLGFLEGEKNNLFEAQNVFDLCLDFVGHSKSQVYCLRGITKMKKKQYDECLQDYDLALQFDENNTLALVCKGFALHCLVFFFFHLWWWWSSWWSWPWRW
eukprot:TRINITY_DN7438_c0_g1_i5.p2 TRINITY_DN7438_c0_g1~~TRINITY_DN7438_c0_g1_i5.p2  ORF type:complete len:368 (-),score=77.97 TRINITY_DN7438_c0_g1_i5:334-1437(-)